MKKVAIQERPIYPLHTKCCSSKNFLEIVNFLLLASKGGEVKCTSFRNQHLAAKDASKEEGTIFKKTFLSPKAKAFLSVPPHEKWRFP